uniref:BTB domain-containing protein n=1 Tax=Panagrolaimus sp. PS1159 TaxID=55785 RepID=A0AC35FXS5_9BILA
MAKEYKFTFCSSIPKFLLDGEQFDRYDDENCILDIGCMVKFEEYGFYLVWEPKEYGFYLVWEPKGKDAGLLDISQIWEARHSGTIKDAKIIFDLEQRPTKDSVEDRTIWITYGWDLVNLGEME